MRGGGAGFPSVLTRIGGSPRRNRERVAFGFDQEGLHKGERGSPRGA